MVVIFVLLFFLCIFFPCLTSWCVQRVMDGRNHRAIADALQALAQAIGNPNRGEAAGAVEYQGLDRFQQNNPPSFNGGYNPDGAQNWIREIEKIFRVMACPKGKKVALLHIL